MHPFIARSLPMCSVYIRFGRAHFTYAYVVYCFFAAPPHMPTHASTPRYPFQPPPRLPGISSSLPPQLVPTRVWSEHKTQEGKIYFYNKVTKQSVWERPKDFELVMPLPSEFTPSPSGAATAAGGSGQGVY